MPLTFDFPLNVIQVTTFHVPSPVDVDASDAVVDDAAFHFELRVKNEGKTITLRHVLRATHDAVGAAAVPEHLTKLNEVSDQLGTKLSRKDDAATLASAANGFGPIALAIAFVCVVALGGAVGLARRGRRV